VAVARQAESVSAAESQKYSQPRKSAKRYNEILAAWPSIMAKANGENTMAAGHR